VAQCRAYFSPTISGLVDHATAPWLWPSAIHAVSTIGEKTSMQWRAKSLRLSIHAHRRSSRLQSDRTLTRSAPVLPRIVTGLVLMVVP
jgi:hypothetical protein